VTRTGKAAVVGSGAHPRLGRVHACAVDRLLAADARGERAGRICSRCCSRSRSTV